MNRFEVAGKLCMLLFEVADELLAGQVFMRLLRHYAHHRLDREEEDRSRNVYVLHALGLLGESYGPAALMRDPVNALEFIKLMLDRDRADEETLTLSLGLLAALLHGWRERMPADITLMIDSMLPKIVDLCSHPSSEVFQLAASVRASIAARHHDPSFSFTSQPLSSKGHESPDFKAALAEVHDQMLPVRANGLLHLKNLILKQDPSIARNLPQITDIFLRNLHDEDSYVYLNAIYGLAALGDVHPIPTIPALSGTFCDKSLPVKVRLELGEALLSITRRCGEVLPNHARYIVYAFLEGARDTDEDIRAGSISNLADACHILGNAMFPYVSDVLSCCLSYLQSAREPLVRRACVLVMSKVMEALGAKVLDESVISVQSLRDMYSVLKRVEAGDEPYEEALTREHAAAALGVLDTIMTTLLFPNK